jgi:hypothetical protein
VRVVELQRHLVWEVVKGVVVRHQVVPAQVQIESRTWKQFIMFIVSGA